MDLAAARAKAARFGGSEWDTMADLAAKASGLPSYLDEDVPAAAAAGAAPEPDRFGDVPEIYIRVENLVVNTSVGARLKLEDIVVRGKHQGLQYNPKNFPACIRRSFEPKSCVLLYGSGRLVCTGCTDLAKARYVINCVIAELRALHWSYKGLRAQPLDVVNVVGHAKLPYRLKLNEFRQAHAYVTSSDDFEGAVIRHPALVSNPETSSMVVLCFRNGDLVITGGRRTEHLRLAYQTLEHDLKQFAEERTDESKLEERRRRKKRKQASKDIKAQPSRYIDLEQRAALPAPDARVPQTVARTTASAAALVKRMAKDDPRKFALKDRNALALFTAADAEHEVRRRKRAEQKLSDGGRRTLPLSDEAARYLRSED